MPNEHAYLAMNRFGLGANKDLIKAFSTSYATPKVSSGSLKNAQDWLIQQLGPYRLQKAQWTSEQAITGFYAFKKQQKQAEEALKTARTTDKKPEKEPENNMMAGAINNRRAMMQKTRGLAEQTALSGIRSPQPLQARLLDFFSNHFALSRTNLAMTLLAPTLEVEAIAPYLHGSFTDMLVSVTSHPAMLLYLNNERSMGPNSLVGKRRKANNRRGTGLNENLAREIMELHTLGVNSGYNQDDVGELARAITGWSIGNVNRNEAPSFLFRKNMHEPGSRSLMGKTYKVKAKPKQMTALSLQYANKYPEMAQGLAILNHLAVHPSTAQHLSYKLAKHFISDEPSKSIVEQMTKTWLNTQGNISSVLQSLITHKDSWRLDSDKFKSPRAFILSACNACDVRKPNPSLFQTLEIMGHGFFNSGSPAGYPDEQGAWLGASALNSRIEWASHFANVIIKRKKLDPVQVAQSAMGPLLNESTLRAIKRAESKSQALALLLMSPEFQRR